MRSGGGRASRIRSTEKVQFTRTAKRSATGCKSNRMSVVSEAVNKRAGALSNGLDHAGGGDDRAQGSIPAGQALGGDQKVRRNLPVLAGEVAAGATASRHDFIRNPEQAARIADLANALHVAIGRHRRAESRARNRLADERSRGAAGCSDRPLQFQRVLLRAIPAFIRTAIAIRGVDLSNLRQHRRIQIAAPTVTGHRKSAQGSAVVALATADELVTLGLAGVHLKLARELQRSLDSFGSAAGEVHRAAAECGPGKVQQLARELFCNRRDELAGVGELQLA